MTFNFQRKLKLQINLSCLPQVPAKTSTLRFHSDNGVLCRRPCNWVGNRYGDCPWLQGVPRRQPHRRSGL